MSDKKQSSVEWFLNEFSKQIEFTPNSELDLWYKELIPIAKAMHREEIKDAFYYGLIDDSMITDNPSEESELYYNQTFNQ